MRRTLCAYCGEPTFTNEPKTALVGCSTCRRNQRPETDKDINFPSRKQVSRDDMDIDGVAATVIPRGSGTHLTKEERIPTNIQERSSNRSRSYHPELPDAQEWLPDLLARLEVHFRCGRWDVAHGVIEHFRAQSTVKETREFTETVLHDILAPQQAIALEKEGVLTIGDALQKKEDWFQTIPLVGARTLKAIQKAVGQMKAELRAT